ncbi:MAG: DegV family protein [Clostridia bacterium]|nr:DegV family protein [Clostridia bacterium]
MSSYVILTDSSCDLPEKNAREWGLSVLPLSFTIDGKTYRNMLDGSEMDNHEFYQMLRNHKTSQTAAVNSNQFIELAEPLLLEGRDILYLGFSSGLSGTYSACAMAAEELSKKYPERKIFAVDTLCASLGQGLLVYLCYLQKKQGATIEQLRDYAENTKLSIAHWFTVDDLHHLKRGGRVSGAAATFGTLLHIKPVMHVDDEGHLIVMDKVRGRKRSINEIAGRLIKTATSLKTVFICHGDCLEEAETLAKLMKEAGAEDILINPVGPVIGSHSGPGTLAVFALAEKR